MVTFIKYKVTIQKVNYSIVYGN